jgi:hypothetical protein
MATKTGTEIEHLPARGIALMETLGIKLSDPSETAWEIAERLALANTADELFNPNGALGWRDHLGRPVFIRRVRYAPGQFEQGPGFFAIVDAVDADTGEFLTLTTGAFNVLVQLARAGQLGLLDKAVKLVESDTPTADGYRPQRLVQA